MTSTAVAGSDTNRDVATDSEPAPPIDRYRIEGRLGAGGMGVVYAAFDPELERRVALKVLAQSSTGRLSRERLLREARAMARLSHPNIVTVFDVGTANGRDYVAMELIDGVSLDDWLRDARPSPRAIVAAFLAAGEGLAAAHAAGLVHRDFKPHNVLRRRDGRILVGDFGLAVGLAGEEPAIEAPARNTPSQLAHLTETGTVLGTPAYMAPEQWDGEPAGPAADQFAFCVALWEALAGVRPYRGGNVDQLRAAMALGPAALDAAEIPRALRAPLRRGLEPDPARRWPSMAALLAQIARSQRNRALAFAAGGGAFAVTATIGILLVRATRPAACEPPLLDPDVVWPDGIVERLVAKGQKPAARVLDADMRAWKSAREAACHADAETRVPQLACLDGVLARLDAAARGAEAASVPRVEPVTVEPAVCSSPHPPTVARTSAALRDVVAYEMQSNSNLEPLRPDRAADLLVRAAADPCALAIAHLVAIEAMETSAARRNELLAAETAAEQCGTDDIGAYIATIAAISDLSDAYNDDLSRARVRRVETAVRRFPSLESLARLDLVHVYQAYFARDLDHAIEHGLAAIEKFKRRGCAACMTSTALYVESLRGQRGDDRAATLARLAELRRYAIDELDVADEHVRAIDLAMVTMQWEGGDVAGAHAAFERLQGQMPNARPRRVVAHVVDRDGKAVAGARVVAAPSLAADSATAAEVFGRGGHKRLGTTDSQGEVVFADAIDKGVVVAELGDRRSAPVAIADRVELVLEPTSRLEGHVELNGEDAARFTIAGFDPASPPLARYAVVSPIGRDGRFAIDGVLRRTLQVSVESDAGTSSRVQAVSVDVTAPVVRGVELAVTRSRRVLHVVVRGTAGDGLARAQVMVFDGKVASMTMAELVKRTGTASSGWARPYVAEHAPAAVAARARKDDLVATIDAAPPGEASACAVAQPKDDADDPDYDRKLAEHLDRIEVRCVPVAPSDEIVVVEVPPFPRFD